MKLNSSHLQKAANSPLFWILLFTICISPLALQYILYYVDEFHYTDAAIQMLQTHDWLTPYQADGAPRFLKPIFSYWMIAGSYKIFGIHIFSSRLPFFICGMGTLVTVYQIALKLTRNTRTALLALLITASNALFILSSSRAIPDIPQTFFLTLAMLGIAGLLTTDHPQKKDLWFTYISFAMAFATKGILAAILAFLTILFLIFNPWKKIKLKELIYWPAIIPSFIIALGWYLLMYLLHGNDFLSSFFNDQVGGRISENQYRTLKNFVFSLLTTPAYFIFWLAPLLKSYPLFKLKKEANTPPIKPFAILSAIWFLFIFTTSIFTIKFYDRYLLPLFPLISIVVAHTIINSNNQYSSYFKKTNSILLPIILLITLVSILLNLRLNLSVFDLLMSGSLLLISLLLFIRRSNLPIAPYKTTTVSILIFMGALSLFISNFSLPTPEDQISKFLQKPGRTTPKEIVFYGKETMAAKLRVITNGKIKIKASSPSLKTNREILIYREDQVPTNDLSNHKIENIAYKWKTFPVIPLLFNPQKQQKARISFKIATPRQ